MPDKTEKQDNYSHLTIEREVRDELVIKGSRFIAYLYPITSEEDFKANLGVLKKKYPDATHHCTAFIVKPDGGGQLITRFNDDGEPSGSAGRPILTVLEGAGGKSGEGLVNIMAVVVRYFGGTKLGVGGLVRAYSEAVNLAFSKAKVVRKHKKMSLSIQFAYDNTGNVEHFLSEFDVEVTARRFGSRPIIDVTMRVDKMNEFISTFNDVTKGKGLILM